MAAVPDSSLALLREGYEFIPRRSRARGADVFDTRLLLRPATCITGPEAARLFYDGGRFTRKRALPPTVLTLVQDKGSALLLDGRAHRHRKEMFLRLVGPDRFAGLLAAAGEEWELAVDRWQGETVCLLAGVEEILCRAVCRWAGTPLGESEARERTREFAAMIDGAGAVGPRQWHAQWLRGRSERWARGLIDGARQGGVPVVTDSALDVISHHRDLDGQLLDSAVAAVELINLLRPTVAVARYVTFAALALHEHPGARERVTGGEDRDLEELAHEVRRLYPFFPFASGRAVESFEWHGHSFPAGRRTLLDIYGTNRDPRVWDAPTAFRPERFRDWDGDPYSFIPQGGGDHQRDHRCPGEWVTVALIKQAVAVLAGQIAYDVPDQDLSIDLSRMPARPESGLLITNIRRRGG